MFCFVDPSPACFVPTRVRIKLLLELLPPVPPPLQATTWEPEEMVPVAVAPQGQAAQDEVVPAAEVVGTTHVQVGPAQEESVEGTAGQAVTVAVVGSEGRPSPMSRSGAQLHGGPDLRGSSSPSAAAICLPGGIASCTGSLSSTAAAHLVDGSSSSPSAATICTPNGVASCSNSPSPAAAAAEGEEAGSPDLRRQLRRNLDDMEMQVLSLTSHYDGRGGRGDGGGVND